MSIQVVGTCSLCGGRVTVPGVWFGINPPTPTCDSCGAVKAEEHGPVIPMKRAPNVYTNVTGTVNVTIDGKPAEGKLSDGGK